MTLLHTGKYVAGRWHFTNLTDRDLFHLAIECDDDLFNIYVNGHPHDVYMDVSTGFDPQQYTMETQSNKKNIEFVKAEYKYSSFVELSIF